MIVVPERALKNDLMLRSMRTMLSFSSKANEMLDECAVGEVEIVFFCLLVEFSFMVC